MTDDQIEKRAREIAEEARAVVVSDDPLVHIAWLIHGLDIWHRTGGKLGHSLDKTVFYVTSNILRGNL